MKDVFTLLEELGWQFEPDYIGYVKGKLFVSQTSVFLFPGDVKHYLETGFVRNMKIFDTGFYQPTAKDFHWRSHKDGRPVQIKRVK